MRVVLCDDDAFLREMVGAAVIAAGHEVAGIADSAAAAVRLIEAARPDAVVVELSLGYNSDFDMVDAAIEVGAQAIVFSHNADVELLNRYRERPMVVPKPDLTALQEVLGRLRHSAEPRSVPVIDRRRVATVPAAGRTPTGISDAQAFFEAVNEARPGDALVAVHPGEGGALDVDDRLKLMRDTDRLLVSRSSLRYFLSGGGEEGVRALVDRMAKPVRAAGGVRVSAVVIADGESGADAFERLRTRGDDIPWPD